MISHRQASDGIIQIANLQLQTIYISTTSATSTFLSIQCSSLPSRLLYRLLFLPRTVCQAVQTVILATFRLSVSLRRLCTTTTRAPRILPSVHPPLHSLPARSRFLTSPASKHYHPTSFDRSSETPTMSDTALHNLARFVSYNFIDPDRG